MPPTRPAQGRVGRLAEGGGDAAPRGRPSMPGSSSTPRAADDAEYRLGHAPGLRWVEGERLPETAPALHCGEPRRERSNKVPPSGGGQLDLRRISPARTSPARLPADAVADLGRDGQEIAAETFRVEVRVVGLRLLDRVAGPLEVAEHAERVGEQRPAEAEARMGR